MQKTGFIGAGKMAEAMIASMLASGKFTRQSLFAVDVKQDRLDQMTSSFGIRTCTALPALISEQGCDTLVLAVKPQDLNAALDTLAPQVTNSHLILSIAAGRTLASLERRLPRARIIRIMPNLPCTVGQGMSAFCAGNLATHDDRNATQALLACFGQALELPEHQFDAVTALSGSGPAFFAFVLDAMNQAGAQLGLQPEHAQHLALQTMLGTAHLLQSSAMTPAELIRSVASARGTTAAGLEILTASDLTQVIAQTLRAAAERSRQLSLESA